jgi:23S rRNA (uracil1939-C5)-methyltransferase
MPQQFKNKEPLTDSFSNLKKNDILITEALAYASDGSAVTKPEGFVIFVRNLLKGEKAKIVITKLLKHYGYGKVLEIIEPSKERIASDCKYYPQCGGCSLRHLSYQEESNFKYSLVEELFQRQISPDFKVEPLVAMADPTHYRNKLQAPISIDNNKLVWGFYRTNSHDLIPISACEIEDEKANELMNELLPLLNKLHKETFRHVLIKTGKTSKEVMIVVITRDREVLGLKEVAQQFILDHPEVKSFMQNINSRVTNVILGRELILLAGQETIEDTLGKLRFKISAFSFYQVNPTQAVKLYNIVKDYAKLTKDDTLVDLYCGIGTITLWLADQAKEAIGIEIIPQAVENAQENAELNNISNARFIVSDASRGATKLLNQGVKPSVIVVDPPRKGLDEPTIEAISTLNPNRLVYVSCNPATLVRDIKILTEKGFNLVKATPVDMFPRTPHVETVVLMSRVEGK